MYVYKVFKTFGWRKSDWMTQNPYFLHICTALQAPHNLLVMNTVFNVHEKVIIDLGVSCIIQLANCARLIADYVD